MKTSNSIWFGIGWLAVACWLSFTVFGAAGGPPETPVNSQPAKDRVEIKDFAFVPAVLTVEAGTKVTFINRDDEPHTVASKDGKFKKSSPLDTDQEFSVTLSEPGEYAYFCTVHLHMTGKITVTAH